MSNKAPHEETVEATCLGCINGCLVCTQHYNLLSPRATLKRSLDWETLNQHPKKRRRCNPFGDASSNVASGSSAVHDDMAISSSNSPNRNFLKNSKSSPFMEATLSKISPEKMSQNIHNEIKRLRMCQQLQFSSNVVERMQDSESSGFEMGPDSPHRPDTPSNMSCNPEKAVFTFKQVQIICERMLQEREDELREKYDAILDTKLAEQYEAFVKFTYDQIQKRYEALPSYLS